jgi:hypothetical protein
MPKYRTAGGWIATPEFAPDCTSTNQFKHEGCGELWYHDMRDGSVRGIISPCCGTCKRPFSDHQLVEPIWEKAAIPLPQIPQGPHSKYSGYGELLILNYLDKENSQNYELIEIFYDAEIVSLCEQIPNPGYGQPNNSNQHTQTISVSRSMVAQKAKFLMGKRMHTVIGELRKEITALTAALADSKKLLETQTKATQDLTARLTLAQADATRRGEDLLKLNATLKVAVEENLRLTKIIEDSKKLMLKTPEHWKQHNIPIIVPEIPPQKEEPPHAHQNPRS